MMKPGFKEKWRQLASCRCDHMTPGRVRHLLPARNSATGALAADMLVGPDTLLDLESASGGGRNKDLSNPLSGWAEALSAFLIIRRTARLVKVRG